MALEFTDANFRAEVLESDKLSVIGCLADRCEPCRQMEPIIDELYQDYDGQVNIGKINLTHNQEVLGDYNIQQVPVTLFFQRGKLIDKLIGIVSKADLETRINAFI